MSVQHSTQPPAKALLNKKMMLRYLSTYLFSSERSEPTGRTRKDKLSTQIIREASKWVQTRKKDQVNYKDMVKLACMSYVCNVVNMSCYLSSIEPKNVNEALKD